MNPGLPAPVEECLCFRGDAETRKGLAYKYVLFEQRLNRAAQEHLAADEDKATRAGIARTTSYSSILEKMLVDPDPRVRIACTLNSRLTQEAVRALARDRSWKVRSSVAAIQDGELLDESELQRLASDKSANVRWRVAARTIISEAILIELTKDADETVRDQAHGSLGELTSMNDQESK